MEYALTDYAAVLWAAVFVSLVTASAAWARPRSSPGALPFALMMTCIVAWNAASAMEAGLVSIPDKVFVSKLGYIGICGVAPLFLRFALAYGGRERPARGPGTILLWTIPAVTLGLVFTNEWHGLVWKSLLDVTTRGGNVLLYDHGPWFWIWVAYNGGASLVALVILLQAAFQCRRIYCLQTVVFLAGAGLPWIGEVLSLLGVLPGLDLPTIGFAGMGVLVLLGMSRLALFDIVPVARSVLVGRMSDGMMVLDAGGRVVDINPAAEALLRVTTEAVGRPGRNVFSALEYLLPRAMVVGNEYRTDVQLPGSPPLFLDVVITVIRNAAGALTGRLIVMRDVTHREKLINELRAALADIKILRGLLPVCSSCRKVRDDGGYWETLEVYLQEHTDLHFTHGLCNDCLHRLYPDLAGHSRY